MMATNDNQPGPALFTRDLNCSECGRQGRAVWQEAIIAMPPLGSRPRLVSLTPGFHAEGGRISSGAVLIVCDDCDMIMPD
jgi:hypothetical protein